MTQEITDTPEVVFVIDGRRMPVTVDRLIVAGWTGRNAKSVEDHIAELEAIGVARPRVTPCFYRLGNSLLTSSRSIDVCGRESSGEAEFVLLSVMDELLVGVGSDHTDRALERYAVTSSKQVCPKPIGKELWRYAEVEGHWDRLKLRSWVSEGGRRRLYQEGDVAHMRTPKDLVARYMEGAQQLPSGTVMYGGTLATIGALSPGDEFEIELEDPVLHRSLRHIYTVRSLEVMD